MEISVIEQGLSRMGQNVPRGASTLRAAQIKMRVYCKA